MNRFAMLMFAFILFFVNLQVHLTKMRQDEEMAKLNSIEVSIDSGAITYAEFRYLATGDMKYLDD